MGWNMTTTEIPEGPPGAATLIGEAVALGARVFPIFPDLLRGPHEERAWWIEVPGGDSLRLLRVASVLVGDRQMTSVEAHHAGSMAVRRTSVEKARGILGRARAAVDLHNV